MGIRTGVDSSGQCFINCGFQVSSPGKETSGVMTAARPGDTAFCDYQMCARVGNPDPLSKAFSFYSTC